MAKTKSKGRTSKKQGEILAKGILEEYKARAKFLKSIGLYKPAKPIKATKAQRARVRKIEAEYSAALDDARTAIVKLTGSKKRRSTIKREAKSGGLFATAKALFLPKDETLNAFKVKTVRGSKGKKFDIIGTGHKPDTGEIVSVKVKTLVPEPPTLKGLKRIKKEAMELATAMDPSKRLRFIVEPHELPNGKHFAGGVSRNSYDDEKFLVRDLGLYKARMPDGMFEGFIANIYVTITPATMTHAAVRESLGYPPLQKMGEKKVKPPKGFDTDE